MKQEIYLDFERALPNGDRSLSVEWKWRHEFKFEAREILYLCDDEDFEVRE